MNVKRIEFLTLGLTFVGALVLFLIFKDNSSYGFGLVYGSLISLINFQILYIGILKNSFQNIIDTKMSLKRNRNIRMLIYLVAIVVVYFLQEKQKMLKLNLHRYKGHAFTQELWPIKELRPF